MAKTTKITQALSLYFLAAVITPSLMFSFGWVGGKLLAFTFGEQALSILNMFLPNPLIKTDLPNLFGVISIILSFLGGVFRDSRAKK